MTGACCSILVIIAYMARQLVEAKNGELNEITDALTAVADDQDLELNRRALLSYSLLQFVCREVSFATAGKLWAPELKIIIYAISQSLKVQKSPNKVIFGQDNIPL